MSDNFFDSRLTSHATVTLVVDQRDPEKGHGHHVNEDEDSGRGVHLGCFKSQNVIFNIWP